MSQEDIVIVGMARTPMGGLLGDLANISAPELGAVAVKAAVKEAGVTGADTIFMGNVLSAGQGQAPARQAALKAGLDKGTQAVTLNKMCGSGLQAVAMARQALLSGESDTVIAGGMESMTRAPFLMAKHRAGQKYGHDKLHDHMALDGLEDAYEGLAMGVYADQAAKEYQFSRESQDAYALETLRRAQSATSEGRFKREIAAIETKAGALDTDELPRKAKPDKIPSLKPAFTPDGTVTAANASAISDGAAALVLMRRSDAEKQGRKIIARIVAQSSHAQEPSKFTSAPVPAIQKALTRADWKVSDVDLWEINEAFAIVPMIAMKELGLSHDIINVNGGACALGHPIGASGARVLVTLLAAMEAQNAKRGVASLCIGGGEGIALAVERA
ncbi:MAG TPA: thiolase family protein [Vitreimonas sp.]|uniref:thiolase family protein n=1 Tax=Vitreimonas sp. TaxID=3069702 RepID=UPI002D726B4E|nr:thiolase family protein [Vitreimonas sp.]HYD87753.1 thiolase family protein [Vitreimonas sp.]